MSVKAETKQFHYKRGKREIIVFARNKQEADVLYSWAVKVHYSSAPASTAA